MPVGHDAVEVIDFYFNCVLISVAVVSIGFTVGAASASARGQAAAVAFSDVAAVSLGLLAIVNVLRSAVVNTVERRTGEQSS